MKKLMLSLYKFHAHVNGWQLVFGAVWCSIVGVVMCGVGCHCAAFSYLLLSILQYGQMNAVA